MATTNANSGDPLQFLGGMSDPSTGLNYLGRGYWSPALGHSLGAGLAAVTDLAPGSFLGGAAGFLHGIGDCLGGAAVGLVREAAAASNPILNAYHQVTGAIQAVRDKGLAQAVLDPVTDTLQALGDWSSPRAAGNSLCNDTLAALTIVGGVDTLVETPEGVCFPAGTPVRTKDGAKPIEQIRASDTVLSADPATGKQSFQKVSRIFVHQSSTLLKIETADGRSLEATPTHPFWVKGKGFVAAKRLARNDLLEDDQGRFVAVERITERHGEFTVYNFEVAHTHTYFAGGWWVHNTCGPSKPPLADVQRNITDDFIENKVLADHGSGAGQGKSEFLPHFSNIQDDRDFIEQALGSGYQSAPWDADHGTGVITR